MLTNFTKSLLLFTFIIFIICFVPLHHVSASEQKTKSAEYLINLSQYQLANNAHDLIFQDIKADFSINGLGLKWQNYQANNYQFYLKTENTDWQIINVMETAGQNNSRSAFSDPIFLTGNKISLKISSPAPININSLPFSEIKIIYFDTSQNKIYSDRKISGTTNTSTIVTRAEWGADESLRFWEPQYTNPVAFVIHHTAGGDGGDDPAATMRGIYYWHAVVLGWGDIGYNYIIDKNGTIYEGRYGGDNVIGAHVYNSTENTNYNDGTIGISIMGCYENQQSGCSTVSDFNDNIKASLASLIAEKAYNLNINLSGERLLFNKSIPSVVGHRDLDYTLCPGNIIEDQISSIKDSAILLYADLAGQKYYQASLINQNFAPAYFQNTENNIAVTYQNTGNLTWLAEKTYLKIYNYKTHEHQKIILTTDTPSQTNYDFNINFITSKPGNQKILLKLYNEEGYVKKSKIIIKVRVDSYYQAKLKKHNLPIAALANWNPLINIKYQNSGLYAWKKDDIFLEVNGQKITSLSEPLLNSDEKTTFFFYLKSILNLQKGNNKLVFKIINQKDVMQNSRFVWNLRID